MTTGERIKKRRKELDVSADKLAEIVGVSRSTIFRYENGEIEKVPMQILEPIAEFLNVSVAYLMGWENVNDLSSNRFKLLYDESMLLRNYRTLNKIGRDEAQKRVKDLTYVPEYQAAEDLPVISEYCIDEVNEETDILELRYYSTPASAGKGLFLYDAVEEKIFVKDTYIARQSDFIIPVSGDSMEPLYSNGDLIFVKSMPVISVGEIGIFVKNGEAYIKRLGKDQLISENSKYDPIDIKPGDNIVCAGKVMGKAEAVTCGDL